MSDWRLRWMPYVCPRCKIRLVQSELRRKSSFMTTFGELSDHFSVECWNVIRLAAGNQSIVHDHFLIHPAFAPIAQAALNRRPRSHSSSANKVRVDQDLGPMTNDRDRFALTKEVPREVQSPLVGAHRIRIVEATRNHQRVEFLRTRFSECKIDIEFVGFV